MTSLRHVADSMPTGLHTIFMDNHTGACHGHEKDVQVVSPIVGWSGKFSAMTVLSRTSVSFSIGSGDFLLTLCPLSSSSVDVCKAATMKF